MDGAIVGTVIGATVTIVLTVGGGALGVTYRLGRLTQTVDYASKACAKIEEKQDDAADKLVDLGNRVTSLEGAMTTGSLRLQRLEGVWNGKKGG